MTVYQSRTRLSLVAGACLAATSAVTLAAPQRGMLSTFPVGLRATNVSNPIPEVEHLKEAGDQSTPPSPFAPASLQPNAPDYTTMFPGMQVDIDAMSTGNGEFPVPESDGSMDPGDRWVVMSVSISDAVTPTLPGPLKDAHDANGVSGSTIVSYYFNGNGSFPPALMGSTVLEMDGKHFGFPNGSEDDIQAFDYGLGFMQAAGGSSSFFSDGHGVYFSVSPSFVQQNGGATFATTTVGGPLTRKAHAADIYHITWDAGTQTWSPPHLAYSWAQLGFEAPGIGCDVDALEVEVAGGGSKTIVYSASVGSTWDAGNVGEISQLMVYHDSSTPFEPTALKDVNGVKVTKKIGIVDEGSGIDEVDAVCGIDPEPSSGGPTEDFGTIKSQDSLAGTPLGLSISRTRIPGAPVIDLSAQRTVFQVTGWGDQVPTNLTCKIYRMPIPSTGIPLMDTWVLNAGWTEVLSAPRFMTEDTTQIVVNHGNIPAGTTWPSNGEFIYMAMLKTRLGRPLAASYVSVIEH